MRRTPRPGPARNAASTERVPVDVADAVDRVPVEHHPEVGQVGDRGRHQPLAAGLVDHTAARLAHHHVEPGASGVQRRHQPDRPTARHHQVAHQAALVTVASAAFSTRSRTLSSTAFATVKTSAVTHAACTRGSAKPSTTTAT